jgi:hypothetical protein
MAATSRAAQVLIVRRLVRWLSDTVCLRLRGVIVHMLIYDVVVNIGQ